MHANLGDAPYHKARKANLSDSLFDRIRKYRRACHLAFFESNPLKRARLLYSAFQEDPGISGACVDWQTSKAGKTPKEIWMMVRDTPEYPWIQHVMTLEARARILIIKNGIEAAIVGDTARDDLKSFWEEYSTLLLPQNFTVGFEQVSRSPNRTKIPYILQLHWEIFGGFLIDDIDRAQLASLADVSPEVVEEALNLFDVFYPTSNGWITVSKEIKMMTMVPAYSRGIGAFHRHISRSLATYDAIAPKMAFLISRWHNAAYKILQSELGEQKTGGVAGQIS